MSPRGGPPGQPGPDDLQRYNAATAHLEPPFAIVDLAALRANAAGMTRRAAGKPIRLASKSVRCRAVLGQVLALDGFGGILAFSLPEALWLADQGVSDDIVVAYPTSDRAALARLASYPVAARTITLMVDGPDHLDLIEKAIATVPGPAPVQVCIDIDTSYHGLGGLVRAGARRSPVRTPADAVTLAQDIAARPALRLAGLMAYEAQIAGVGDKPAGRPLYGMAIRLMQGRSAAELAARRAAIAGAVRAVTPLRFVNGGGTGSIERTAAEPAVTEIGAGSGLYQPSLFDSYRAFSGRPAALFALPVVAGPAVAWSPRSAAGSWRPARLSRAGCRARAGPPGCGWTPRRARVRCRRRCSARRPTGCASGTGSGSAMPKPVSCASGSTNCT